MAKTHEARQTANRGGNTAVAETIPELSAKVQRAVDEIKKPFTSYVRDFAALNMKREELAPKFMKAFGLWQAETGGTFVAWIRFLDPTVGGTRKEYREHRSYQAADYLRRIVGNVQKRGTNTADRTTQAAPAPPSDAFARLLAAMLSMIPEAQKTRLSDAMRSELHWNDRQVERAMNQAEHVDPLVEIKGRTLDNLKLSMPEHEEREEAAA